MQLQPSNGRRGVLEACGPRLKQLRLCSCILLEGPKGLAAALCRLTGLEHLSVSGTVSFLQLPDSLLLGLQQLTYLQLSHAFDKNLDLFM